MFSERSSSPADLWFRVIKLAKLTVFEILKFSNIMGHELLSEKG